MAAKSAVSVPRPANLLTPERRRFSLSGPSRPLDLTRNAARRDLADIRLAGRWFAPHYAVAQVWTCVEATALHAAREGIVLRPLTTGERIGVLEIAGDWAWGFSEQGGDVGYVPIRGLAIA